MPEIGKNWGQVKKESQIFYMLFQQIKEFVPIGFYSKKKLWEGLKQVGNNLPQNM